MIICRKRDDIDFDLLEEIFDNSGDSDDKE